MTAPHVLIVLDTSAGWSRGILQGFARVAHRHGFLLLHYHPDVDFRWLASEWPLDAVVLGPAPGGSWPTALGDCVSVSLNCDRSAEGISSVCLDESRIARLALSHLVGRGFRNLTTFRFDESNFGVERENYFAEGAHRVGANLQPGWWASQADRPPTKECAADITRWLHGLPKPCGVFVGCDAWARIVARYARAAGLRVPEDLALIGVDNDVVECELMAPPLSSVALPWRAMGDTAARLVLASLRGRPMANRRVIVQPVDVVSRRSTDTLAIRDPLVVAAVKWIHEHARERFRVPDLARAVGASRQRLERHFRRELGRTVFEEMRRTRVEIARRLLSTTAMALADVARQSGFTTAALLNAAFRREVGVPPGAYRRQVNELVRE